MMYGEVVRICLFKGKRSRNFYISNKLISSFFEPGLFVQNNHLIMFMTHDSCVTSGDGFRDSNMKSKK